MPPVVRGLNTAVTLCTANAGLGARSWQRNLSGVVDLFGEDGVACTETDRVYPGDAAPFEESAGGTPAMDPASLLACPLNAVTAHTLSSYADAGLIVTDDAEVVGVLGEPLYPVLLLADAFHANSGLRIDTDDARMIIARAESLNAITGGRSGVSLDAGISRTHRLPYETH